MKITGTNEIWLVGAGPMALDYLKVLESLGYQVTIIGRGEESARKFEAQSGHAVVRDGLSSFLLNSPALPVAAVVAVGVEALAQTTMQLLEAGVRRILVEKPGALTRLEIDQVDAKAREQAAEVVIAYNRRFYASTLLACRLIDEDGGVQSLQYEFTEWGHIIEGLEKAPGVKEAWLIGNSTHVIDLAFHLGGEPVEMEAHTAGRSDWHAGAAVFTGAGKTDRGALFSYHANWGSPGRWSIEVMTAKRRLIFRPMEILQVVHHGSVNVEVETMDDALDKDYKPGLYEQTRQFLEVRTNAMCLLSDQARRWAIYQQIAGYSKD